MLAFRIEVRKSLRYMSAVFSVLLAGCLYQGRQDVMAVLLEDTVKGFLTDSICKQVLKSGPVRTTSR